jgi:hypothetical protein
MSKVDITKPIALLTRYKCENCGRLHTEHYGAEKCCPPEVTEVLVCSICNEEFWVGFDEKAAQEHLATAHGTSKLTVLEQYMEELRFGRPMLGEWAFTMFADDEPEIRNALIRI